MSLSLNTNLFNLSTPFIWCWTTLRPGTFKRYAKTDIYRILSFAARWEFPLTDVLEDIPVRRGNLRPGLYLQRIAKYLLRDLQQGKSLSASMEKRKGLFDSAEVEMVRAGEENGCLPEMLQTLARLHQSQLCWYSFRTFLPYPLTVGFVTLFIISSVLIFIMPKFLDIFLQMGCELPYLTQSLMDASDTLIHKTHYILLCGILAFIFRHRIIAPLKFFLPLAYFRQKNLSRFLGSLGTLLQAKVPVDNALEAAGCAANHRGIQKAVGRIRERIEQGMPFAAAFEKESVIPGQIQALLALAESANSVPQCCQDLSKELLENWEAKTHRMIQMLEPASVMLIGLFIGLTVISLYLPLFNLPVVILHAERGF